MKFVKCLIMAALANVMKSQLVHKFEIGETFKVYDKDRNGKITKDEFANAFNWEADIMANNLAKRHPREMRKLIDGFYSAYDWKKDHGLSLKEFTAFMREEIA